MAPAPQNGILADDLLPCTGTGEASHKCFPTACNFFVPFAQKDARFGQAQIT
jgi:hypothetical protein